MRDRDDRNTPTRFRHVLVVGLLALSATLAPLPSALAAPAGRLVDGVEPLDGSRAVASADLGSTLLAPATMGPQDVLRSASGRFSLVVANGDPQLSRQTISTGLFLRERPNRFSVAAIGGFSPLLVGQRQYSDTLLVDRVEFRADGNLVVMGTDGTVLAQTASGGRGGTRLVMQDDGNVVIYDAAGRAVYAANSHEPSTKYPFGTILPGERMVSADRATSLVMQTDGNLVLYRRGVARFSSGTFVPGSGAVLQDDGNLVVRSPGLQPLWNLGSTPLVNGENRIPNAFYGEMLHVLDGDFRVAGERAGAAVSLGGSAWQRATLEPGETMVLNDRRRAPGGVELVMQLDGNLVQYVRGVPVFDIRSRGASNNGDLVRMQSDGNLVVYDDRRPFLGLYPQWESRTAGNPGSRFVLQNDGNGVIYTTAGTAVFATRR